MKRISIFIIFFCLLSLRLFSFEAYIGPSMEFNLGVSAPLDYNISFGFSNSYKLTKNFFLEHFVNFGFSYITNYYDQTYVREYGFSSLTAFYPVFKLGKGKYYFSLSIIGVKFKATLAAYESLLCETKEYYYSDDYFGYFPLTNINVGISEKFGFDMILGKENNIIYSVFYVNIDLLYQTFQTIRVRPSFNFGTGTSVTFKLESKRKK